MLISQRLWSSCQARNFPPLRCPPLTLLILAILYIIYNGLDIYIYTCPCSPATLLACPGVKLTVAWLPFATNVGTGATNFQIFTGFRRHHWRLSCSCVYSYGMSRLVSLVCSVCTLSDQLQATGAPGADTAYCKNTISTYVC